MRWTRRGTLTSPLRHTCMASPQPRHAIAVCQVKVLERKTTCLRRQLVFALACKVMRRKFDEAGLGPGNDPAPPSGLSAIDESDLEAEGALGAA